MPRRQQRTPALRRNFPANQPRVPPGFDWQISRVDGQYIWLYPCLQNSLQQDDTGVYVVNGTPDFRVSVDNLVAVGAVAMEDPLNPGPMFLRVDFGATLSEEGNLTLFNGVMSWQGPFGSQAVQKSIINYGRAKTGIDSVTIDGGEVLVVVNNVGGKLFFNGTLSWEIVETGATVAAYTVVDNDIRLTMSALPSVGMNLSIGDGENVSLNQQLGWLVDGTYVIS